MVDLSEQPRTGRMLDDHAPLMAAVEEAAAYCIGFFGPRLWRWLHRTVGGRR